MNRQARKCWETGHRHGRQLAVGLGAHRNTPEHTLAQIARVRKAEGGRQVDGLSFFSYAAPRTSASETRANGIAFLATGAGGLPGAFLRPAPIPAMPWIERPTRGWIAGVATSSAAGADDIAVKVKKRTDGNGCYGLTDLEPGRYHVRLDGSKDLRVTVRVEAGTVARADLRR